MTEVTRRPWALVTGAARGIGAATAERLAADGYNLVLTARKAGDLDDVAAACRQRGADVIEALCDVADPAALPAVARIVAGHDIQLQALVNNAGTLGPIGGLMEVDAGDWEATVVTNLLGVFRALRAFVPLLSADRRAAIVNLSSGAGHKPMEGWSAYCASKAGLAMLTRSAAGDLADRAFVYGFQPGVVHTGMQARIRASRINPVSRLPRESLLPAGDPAAIIAWLCRTVPEDLNGTEFRADDPSIRARAGLAPKAA